MAFGKITGSVIQDNTITESNLAFGVSGQSAASAWATDTLKVNIIESDDSTAIQINDGVNISGILSANTIDTNVISSSDSTAIQIEDSINLGSNTITANTGSFVNFTLSDTLTIGSQIIYAQGTNGFSVNEDFDPSNSSTQTAYHYTTGAGRETLAFTLARTGQFTDGFGIYGTSANNTFVTFGEQSNTSFEWRRGVGIRPLDLDGGTLMMRLSSAGDLTINNDIIVQGSVIADTITTSGSNNDINISANGTGDVVIGSDLVVNTIKSDDSIAIQINDSLNVSGTISADTIDVNTLTSNDSSGININDTKLYVNGSTVLTVNTADEPAVTTSNGDVDHVIINDGGIAKRIALANINISSFNNDANYASAAGSGFSASTVTSFPTSNDSVSRDYSDGEPAGVGTGTDATTDAFGVALGTTFDCMEPVGSVQTTDLGTDEAYVGA